MAEEIKRCPSKTMMSGEPFRGPDYEAQCGLPEGHDGPHTVLVPSNMPWANLPRKADTNAEGQR